MDRYTGDPNELEDVTTPKSALSVSNHNSGLKTVEESCRIVPAVRPKSVNVLVGSSATDFTVPKLADLGVRRISVGSALSRAAWGAFMRGAKGILEDGTFDGLDGAAPFPELNDIFEQT